MRKHLIILSLLFFPAFAHAESFDQWLNNYKQRAAATGLSRQVIDHALQDVTYEENVITLDRKQPEGQMTLLEYVAKTVTPLRVKNGRENYFTYQTLLRQVEKTYGVSPFILVALWGKETDYGGFTGKSLTINSLATLAYEGRRRQYFEQELLNAIGLLDDLGWNPSEMKGSWAGAVGQCQFMPSNYLRYGVDGDRNGRVDLWHSMPDIFNSMANMLKKEGWRAYEGWGQKITLPAEFDKNLIGRDKEPQSFRFWEQRGVRFTYPVPVNVANSLRVYQPDGPQGPAYILYPNFDVLMRWNRSGYFATAVGRLADQISASQQ